VGNPFAGFTLGATFSHTSAGAVTVSGFCNSADGTVYRLRFMPEVAKTYAYTITFSLGASPEVFAETFTAAPSVRKGVVRVDPDHPFHFKYSGSGEHYFWNGATAYWLLGFQSDAEVESIVRRLASHRINRIRVTLNGRHEDGMRWNEKFIKPSPTFRLAVCPWPCARPENIVDPGADP